MQLEIAFCQASFSRVPEHREGGMRRDVIVDYEGVLLGGHSPVEPSIDSRMMSACPLCRAYSSIM